MKTRLLLTLLSLISFATISTAQNPADGCAGVPVLTVGGVCVNTNFVMAGTYSNGGLVNASCATAGNDRDDGWYQFVATAVSTTIEAQGDRAFVLSVWSACAGGTELGCDLVAANNTATVVATTVIGNTYFVQIHRRGGNNNATINGSVCAYSAAAPTCSDGIQNQGETGIDCGGPCAACVPTCFDGIQNQGETGIDCGGPCLACGSCPTDAAIPSLPYNQTGLNTSGAGDDFSSTDACGSSYMNGDDYVLTYTPAANECIDIALANTGTWVGVFITDDCPSAGGANCIASATLSGGNPSISGASLNAGTTYYFTISTFPTPQSTAFDISIVTVACPVLPPNDECSGAIALTVNPDLLCGTTTAGTVALATASIQSDTECGGTEDDDVWFSFVATSTTHDISLLNVAGSTTDMYHSVWEGTCAGGLIATTGSCSDADQQTLSGLTIGNTYFVRVYTWTSTAGQTSTFDICIGTLPPVGPCVADMTINSTTYSNTGLTTNGFGDDFDSGDACGSSYMNGDDIIIEYNPTTTECVSIVLSNTDTWVGLFVLDGCPDDPGAGCLASNTNSSGNPTIPTFNVTAGTSYYIIVSTSPTPQFTAFDLDIEVCPPTPDCGLNYTHSTIAYNPQNYNTGTAIAFADDRFASAYTSIGFEFCYDGVTYQDVLVSSNGYITFPSTVSAHPFGTANVLGGTSQYHVDEDAPNTTDAPVNAIMGPWHDIDPSITGSTIRTNTFGGAPNRIFSTTFNTVGMFSCTADDFTGQIHLLEGGLLVGDEIQVHIGEKTICVGWSEGGAILGLTDYSGTVANIPAGYNYSTPWAVPTNSQEGHRWTSNCGLCSPLPVELTDFKGKSYDNYNALTWNTATEINNDYFVLEKSNGGASFEEVVKIEGAGNSNEILNYSYNHKNPREIEYYRLRQVDFDGKWSYSKIIHVRTLYQQEINIYPNPSKENFSFDIRESNDETFTITYTNLLGSKSSEEVIITSGTNNYQVSNFVDLPLGIYFVQIFNQNGEVISSQKIIKE